MDALNTQSAGVERLTTEEVMALARISRASLWRRVGDGRLPMPIDRARQALFSRVAVIEALAITRRPLARAVVTEARLDALRRRRHKKEA